MKKTISLIAAGILFIPTVCSLTACGGKEEQVLRVYSWEEYIDEGGDGSYAADVLELDDAPSILDDFETWYEETYGTAVRVEYSTFGTNEDLYNQLKLGDSYDLVCPSEYMIMKLAAENMLEPYTEDFFDTDNELNYYVNNVSPFIDNVFSSNYVSVALADGTSERHAWREYAAGYMWGTTGFIYNPDKVEEDDLAHWSILLNSDYKNKVTTKDNVRDSYFVGLGILYEEELLALRNEYETGTLSGDDYNRQLTKIMNRTDEETVQKVQEILLDMKANIYGFETDTGKNDMITDKIYVNFAWSGDAVYAMDQAEYPDGDTEPRYFNYYIPEECANLWFDGWVMPKGANKELAQAFVNYMAQPTSAVRNMYYIGYSSVIAGDEVFEYVLDTYSVEDGDEEEAMLYDVSYFFGEGAVIPTYEDQFTRQLYAQYPPEDVMLRCAVMQYFDADAGERINELWTQVKGAELDAWAIIVICLAVVVAVVVVLYVKLGSKLDVRIKPKKGYRKIDEKPL